MYIGKFCLFLRVRINVSVLFVSLCASVCACVVVEIGKGMWNPYGECNLFGNFRLPPSLLIGDPPGVFCPDDSTAAAALEEELELELVGSAPPVNVGIPGVGENPESGEDCACGGVPCPLPGPVDMMLR